MFCINCFHGKTQVSNSRGHKKIPQIWRRRSCPECGFAFTTYENFALDELLLIEKEGSSEAYNRGQLISSLIDSLRSTGNDPSEAYWLMITIEEKLLSRQRQQEGWQKISSRTIAELAYETLVAYNTVAGYAYGAAHGLLNIGQKRRRGRPAV